MNFWKKDFEHKIYVLIFSIILSETFLILRRIERDMIKNVLWDSCKLHVIFVRFQWNLNFFDRFSKNTQISNLIKIHPLKVKLFHADGQTSMTKEVTVLFLSPEGTLI
jgi:hypothetical protein